MKVFTKSMMVALGLGALLFGCRPDQVGPTDGPSKDVAGAFDDVHVNLDTVCAYADTIFFRASDGTDYVNKCVGAGGIAVPCVTNQRWGKAFMYNGYVMGGPTNVHWLKVDFELAPGYVNDFRQWLFTTSGQMPVDPNTGVPGVGTDWSSIQENPARNAWEISILVNDLPLPCFDMACRMSIVRLRLNGSPNENFRTSIWARNRNWNVTGDPEASNSEFVVHYCPFGCLEGVVPPRLVEKCVNFQVGVPELGSCVTLDADTTASDIHYSWSTGATTKTISVCPTATTSYTCTISNATRPVVIKTFNVNYTNVGCAAGNSPLHKVRVCHRPPGNPTNVQNICIDWSGVPAHVKRFRAPGSNPNQGHDSGCEIGVCGSNPCAQ